ncbi:hypothetical protein GWI33_006361 [Rhynchophorus ferrugineus]|uniref:Uncharacterized protein n=1 Tax=Rhynchophorus ferrugineus TaxID=354439 RepID=A0A834ISI1_RHYFE|nr:hypothetical protein GWI33_006361 [Rhynchophorus ferrugineus]
MILSSYPKRTHSYTRGQTEKIGPTLTSKLGEHPATGETNGTGTSREEDVGDGEGDVDDEKAKRPIRKPNRRKFS